GIDMTFDIRKADTPTGPQASPQPPSVENSTIDWLRQNRHLLGPYKTGQILQATPEGFRPAAPVGVSQEVVTQKQHEVLKEASMVPPDRTVSPLKVPTPVQFSDLSPEKQRAISAAL